MIVLNWHWDCAEPPPPLDVAGITVCDSCNVAISVRVASPGDTGDLVQSIAAETAAAASDIAGTIETALQSAPAPAPVIPPAPTASAAPAATDPAATAPVATAPVQLPQAVSPATEDNPPGPSSPRSARTQPSARRAPRRRDARPEQHEARGRSPAAGRAAAIVRVVVIERWIEQHGAARATSGPAVRKARPAVGSGRGPIPSAPFLPSVPVPVLAGAGLASAQGGGPGAVAALAGGLALVFAYMIFTALRLLPVVPPARGADANPHPPG